MASMATAMPAMMSLRICVLSFVGRADVIGGTPTKTPWRSGRYARSRECGELRVRSTGNYARDASVSRRARLHGDPLALRSLGPDAWLGPAATGRGAVEREPAVAALVVGEAADAARRRSGSARRRDARRRGSGRRSSLAAWRPAVSGARALLWRAPVEVDWAVAAAACLQAGAAGAVGVVGAVARRAFPAARVGEAPGAAGARGVRVARMDPEQPFLQAVADAAGSGLANPSHRLSRQRGSSAAG